MMPTMNGISLYYLVLCIILYRHGIKCWRISGRSDRNAPATDAISANIRSRAANTLLWSRPPGTNANEEDANDLSSEATSDRRTTLIRQCTQTLERAGSYKVRGSSSSAASFCYVLVKAPALQRIRFTFSQVNVDCERSGLMLFDGWQLLDRKRPSILDSIPPVTEAEGESRKLYICSENAATYRSLETSQNIGQILYFLHSGNDVSFQIQFLPDNQVCNAYIGRDDEPISLSIRVDQPQNCRVYVNGAARLRVTALHLDETTAEGLDTVARCGSSTTNYVSIQANSTTWNPKFVRQRYYHCDTDLADFNTPCRFNIIELHSVTYGSQSARLEIDPLAAEDREPWSYYCY